MTTAIATPEQDPAGYFAQIVDHKSQNNSAVVGGRFNRLGRMPCLLGDPDGGWRIEVEDDVMSVVAVAPNSFGTNRSCNLPSGNRRVARRSHPSRRID